MDNYEMLDRAWSELTAEEKQQAMNAFSSCYKSGNGLTGNQVTSYLKKHNETLAKVREDEPIFVLRAQDNSAPMVVLHWIGLNADVVDEAKLNEAFKTFLAMRRYDQRRDPT